eukprot:EG_transcript_34895
MLGPESAGPPLKALWVPHWRRGFGYFWSFFGTNRQKKLTPKIDLPQKWVPQTPPVRVEVFLNLSPPWTQRDIDTSHEKTPPQGMVAFSPGSANPPWFPLPVQKPETGNGCVENRQPFMDCIFRWARFPQFFPHFPLCGRHQATPILGPLFTRSAAVLVGVYSHPP